MAIGNVYDETMLVDKIIRKLNTKKFYNLVMKWNDKTINRPQSLLELKLACYSHEETARLTRIELGKEHNNNSNTYNNF